MGIPQEEHVGTQHCIVPGQTWHILFPPQPELSFESRKLPPFLPIGLSPEGEEENGPQEHIASCHLLPGSADTPELL